MKEKFIKLIKNKNFIIVCCVLLLTVITMKLSFSYAFSIKPNDNIKALRVGPLEVTYGKEGNLFAKMNVKPMSDEEGLANSDIRIIDIHNLGNKDTNYSVTIKNDIEKFVKRGGYKESDYLIPLDKIKIAVYKYEKGKSNLIVGPTLITNLPKNNINNHYELLSGNLGSISGTNVTYQIKTWLGEFEIPQERNNFIYLNLEVLSK